MGDITQEVLEDNGYTFLVIAYNINKTDPENQEKLNRLAAYAKDKGYRFYGLSASAADDIRKYTEAHQVNYDYCSTDEIQLKTIVRSNPGLTFYVRDYPRQMGPPGSAGSGGITEQRLSFLLPARTTGYHRQISDLQPDYALYRLYISLYNPEI